MNTAVLCVCIPVRSSTPSAAFVAPSVGCLSRTRGTVAAHRSCAAVAARQRVSPLFMAEEAVDPEILAKVKEIVVSQLAVEESQVIPAASFTQDLGADSLDTVELIMALEEGFDVSEGVQLQQAPAANR